VANMIRWTQNLPVPLNCGRYYKIGVGKRGKRGDRTYRFRTDLGITKDVGETQAFPLSAKKRRGAWGHRDQTKKGT